MNSHFAMRSAMSRKFHEKNTWTCIFWENKYNFLLILISNVNVRTHSMLSPQAAEARKQT